MSDISTTLTTILHNELGITVENNAIERSFLDLGLDSIALMEFQFVVAKHYDIDENELNLIGEESLAILESRLITIRKGIVQCAIPLS
ncbi:phosphopantetheine binding protein [Serratia fonticola]|jgi:acyl carrier protein|uniref:Phosphopantetheine binding protein n=1 Tax=Serratia fonticola TaxID=47917 RepID=A0A542BQN5_SERFO|nr:acyl carrier protein [Serratia fonticola]TQI80891.1 phosphopantetheine binding protein [Serratia fonticola]TQI97084.1 phosphopantetheine binding protein [Serratia fonticola]TVZ71580.1 phosphopantetheine binding protein [Serratia fonticola]